MECCEFTKFEILTSWCVQNFSEVCQAVCELQAIFEKNVRCCGLLGNTGLNSIASRRNDFKRYLLYICMHLFAWDSLEIVLLISTLFGRCFGLYFIYLCYIAIVTGGLWLLQSTWREFCVVISSSTSCVELKFLVNIPNGVINTNLVSGCKFMLLTADWVLIVLCSLAQIWNFLSNIAGFVFPSYTGFIQYS